MEWKKTNSETFEGLWLLCICVQIGIDTWTKLEPRSTQCIFVGYNTNSKPYKLINIVVGKLILNHDVILNEIVTFVDHAHGKTPLVMGDISKHTNIIREMGDGST
jgi:hypothetical protein